MCDNTREAALGEGGPTFKVKHSRYSGARLTDARNALAIVHSISDSFAAEVARLCETTVSSVEWARFLDAYVPTRDDSGSPLAGRAKTIADKKRDTLSRLYTHDLRVAPWAGTAHGVVQAVNTYEHHEAMVRGATRAERNMLRAVTGEWGRLDARVLEALDAVLV